MIVKYQDKEYNLDLDEMDVSQARTIKVATGLTVKALQQGMVEVDPDALVGLFWYMKTTNGERCNIRTVDFKVAEFSNALADGIVNGLTEEQKIELEEATGVNLHEASAEDPKDPEST